jgi:catechol 2,3-dioxygenase
LERSEVKLPDATRMGAVEINVRDVERELRFYEALLGLRKRRESNGVVDLGIVRLRHTPDAPARARGASGLYHMAILVPSRPDLGRAIAHLVRARYPLEGASDHLVSEALYLSDPEGNGIEIYRDRPRDEWRWSDGHLHMATEPMDVEGVLSSAGDSAWNGMPDGTVMGHVHLQVRDVAPAEAFYRDAVGFDVTTHYPSAAFLSAGRYHHHLAVNTWGTAGGPPASSDALGLRAYEIVVPDRAALDAAEDTLRDARRVDPDALEARDPSGNALVLRSGS